MSLPICPNVEHGANLTREGPRQARGGSHGRWTSAHGPSAPYLARVCAPLAEQGQCPLHPGQSTALHVGTIFECFLDYMREKQSRSIKACGNISLEEVPFELSPNCSHGEPSRGCVVVPARGRETVDVAHLQGVE